MAAPIWFAMAKPMPMPTPAPAVPPGASAAFVTASAVWKAMYLLRSPTTPMLVRRSSASSTCGGSEMFSTRTLVSSRPYSANSGAIRSVRNTPSWS
jgi:hypothetical protein